MSREAANIVKPESDFSKERDEDRNLVQRALDNLDVSMDKLHVYKNKCWGDEDSQASVQQSQEDPGRAQDTADSRKETPLLLEWSPEKSPINAVPKEDSKHCEQEFGEDHRVKFGHWSTSEMKTSPESSPFLLHWPPEGSSLKGVQEKSGVEAGQRDEDKQKRGFLKRRKESTTEIRKDPEFAWFLPKWPPEGSTFVPSGGQSLTDPHQK